MTVSLRGLGAVSLAPYTDTGAGITPENFESRCCGWFGLMFASDACNGWANVNPALFGGYYSPCARGALDNMRMRPAVTGVAPVPVPPIDATPGIAPGADVWSFPYSDTTPACNGQKVVTVEDAENLKTCLAQHQAAAQAAAVMASMTANASEQCAAIKADCANRAFAQFLKPNSDCTDCVFDWTQNSSLFMVAGLVIVGLILVKAIKG
jgi:hypothetical protein